jgi:MHS family proline/betaine transporter-like MFS transporter
MTVSLTDEASLAAWGWRVPFLVGAGLAGSVWIARRGIEESPEYARLRDASELHANPFRHALAHQQRGLLRAFAISSLGSITYYVGIGYVPAFLTAVGAMSESLSLWLSTIAAVAVIGVTPFVGMASDRWGRRPVLIAVALLSAVLPAGLFSLMAGPSASQALLGAVVLALVAGGMSAVGAIASGEQFGGASRASGLGIGYTVATAVFGGLTPYVAQRLIEASGAPQVPGVMIAVVAVAALPVFWLMPETAPAKARPTLSRE